MCDVVDLDLDAELAGRVADLLGQVGDVEDLGELVEDAVLAGGRRVLGRQRDALERVDDVQEAARLAALAVHRERVADHGLHGEAVERRAEQLVVVEAGDQALVEARLRRLDAVDDALVEIGGAQAPDAAGEVDVVAVVHLRQVVERARAASGTAACPCAPCARSR